MTRPIPWPRLVAESVLIVASILLAFSIDTWWEGRGIAVEEREILADLQQEFLDNVQVIGTTVAQHHTYSDRLDRLSSMTEQEARSLPSETAGEYVQAMASWWTFDARTARLDGVITAGKLAILSDAELRNLLSEWKVRLEDIAEEDEALLVQSTERVAHRMAVFGGPWFPGQAYVAGTSDLDLGQLRADPEMMQLVRVKAYYAATYVRELETLASHAEAVLARIDRATDVPR